MSSLRLKTELKILVIGQMKQRTFHLADSNIGESVLSKVSSWPSSMAAFKIASFNRLSSVTSK